MSSDAFTVLASSYAACYIPI